MKTNSWGWDIVTGLKKCCTFFFLHLNRSSMEILQRMGVEEMFSVFQKWARGWKTIAITFFACPWCRDEACLDGVFHYFISVVLITVFEILHTLNKGEEELSWKAPLLKAVYLIFQQAVSSADVYSHNVSAVTALFRENWYIRIHINAQKTCKRLQFGCCKK